MKKTLLAAALIVGFAGVAQAETSVTLYGIVDTGYGYNQFKYDGPANFNYKSTKSGLQDGIVNGNRWGMRGSEDLGDGLRAIFQLEAGFNLGTGTHATGDRMFHRQAFVGLASDSWGTFTMGRQYNMADSFLSVNSTHSLGDIDKAFGAASQRVDNMFKYVTPDFSGFQAGVGYAANGNVVRDGTDAGSKNRGNYTTAGLQYNNGPIHAAATYDRSKAGDAEKAVTAWALVGSYDFEVVKLALGYGQDRYGKINGVGGFSADAETAVFGVASSTVTGYDDYLMANDFKSHNYFIGLSAPLGGGVAGVSWTRSSSNLDDSDKLGSNAKNQNIYSAKYLYPLSKRTSVYAYGSYGSGIAYLDGAKAKEAGVGLNVKF